MNTQVGKCPQCGAPIYQPTIWHGTGIPPAQYSCLCYSRDNYTRNGTGFSQTLKDDRELVLEKLDKIIELLNKK